MVAEPDIFDLIAKGQMGSDGEIKPAARSKEDLLVARITYGSHLGYTVLHMKAALAFFSHLVKEKNVMVASSTGDKRPITQKEYAKIVLRHYIEVAHLHTFHVAYHDQPGPIDVDQVVNRVMLNKEIADLIKEAY